MSQAELKSGRSAAVIVAAILLLAITLIDGGLAALFGAMLARQMRGIVWVGNVRLYSDFAIEGLLTFGLLLPPSLYGGLGAFWRWRGWRFAALLAGWGLLGLSIYGIWMDLRIYVPTIP